MSNEPKKVTEIWAWVMTEPDGEEGIPAFYSPSLGMMLPCVGSDSERVLSLREVVTEIAAMRGLPLKLLKFTSMEVIEDGVVGKPN